MTLILGRRTFSSTFLASQITPPESTPLSYDQWNQGSQFPWAQLESHLLETASAGPSRPSYTRARNYESSEEDDAEFEDNDGDDDDDDGDDVDDDDASESE